MMRCAVSMASRGGTTEKMMSHWSANSPSVSTSVTCAALARSTVSWLVRGDGWSALFFFKKKKTWHTRLRSIDNPPRHISRERLERQGTPPPLAVGQHEE